MLFVNIHSLDLSKSDDTWADLFEKTWPSYRRWFAKEGLKARPGYLTSLTSFDATFPELTDLYKRLCKLAGNNDLSSRFLSMYCPPPYMSGCSQVAWTKDQPALFRNYDYSPSFFEGVIMKTNWLKPVIGMSDCTWGLLDGINADGLCASLTFGGRRITAKGFGIPLIIRYCLETCSTTSEALAQLVKIPAHMAYNVTIMDRELNYATIYFVPGQENQVHFLPVGTNHQEEITWPDYAAMTRTVERRNLLESAVVNPKEHFDTMLQKFLAPPLYNTAFEKAFGTLYTAAYLPQQGQAQYHWPTKQLYQSFEHFVEGKISVTLKTNALRKMSL